MSIRFSTGMWGEWLSTWSAGRATGILEDAVLRIYSGTQPSDPDAAETGDLLCEVTIDGGSFTPGVSAGLNFQVTTSSLVEKETAEVWLGAFLLEGTLGWFRLYANDMVTDESSTAVRIDGSVGTSRSDLKVVSTDATIGGSTNISKFQFTFSIVS